MLANLRRLEKRRLRIAMFAADLACGLCLSGGFIASWGNSALAQLTPDTTLGSENSRVISISPTVDLINGGATRGANLFHSFREFNVGSGASVFFTNPTGIENILTRVTGTNPSNIFGTLGVTGGNANLFLINPNGIIFGGNARLKVNGSFVATTANAIGLANGDIFSANPSSPLPTQLLNVNPNAFFFNQVAAQPIINRSVAKRRGLQVPLGESLLLVGGDVSLDGGRLQAPGGRVELAGVAGEGTVGLNINGSDLRLNFPVGVPRGDVSLDNGAQVNVAAKGGGSIAINARNFTIAGGGSTGLGAGIAPGLGFPGARAGDIEINATEAVNLSGGVIFNAVQSEAVGNGGDINITTGSLRVTDGAQLQAATLGEGNAGSVNIHAGNTVSFDGVNDNGRSSAAYSRVLSTTALGNSGGVNITTGSLYLTNGALLSATTFGKGNAGSVNINARDTVSFDGETSDGFSSGTYSTVYEGAEGKGGSINITTGSLSVTNGALLSVSTLGKGDAGSVNINARDRVSFDGVSSNGVSSAAFSAVRETAEGNGGGIKIETRSLSVTNGAFLSASTEGQGDAGSINITTESLALTNGSQLQAFTAGQGNANSVNIVASDTISLDGMSSDGIGSGILSDVLKGAVGNGGSINITTGSLFVTNGAQVTASTRGQGNAGSVNINARNTVSFDGVGRDGYSSGAFSTVEQGAEGKGRDISITTGSLFVTNGAQLNTSTIGQGDGGNVTLNTNTLETLNSGAVSTTSFGSGKAGNITINVTDSIALSGNGGLFANAAETSTNQGGSLSINTGQLIVRDGAQVTVSSLGSGNAGSLAVEADSIFLSNQGKLTGTTASGIGGNITLQVGDLILMRNGSAIATTAQNNGSGGNIRINAPFIVAVPVENNDIVANADQGFGGRIDIKATGIYGLEFRDKLTRYSDINASSNATGKDGIVEINTPGVDPSQGLTNLPTDVVDASNQIAQNCAAGGGKVAQNEFIITGRGGLPPSPGDTLSTDAVWTDLRTPTAAIAIQGEQPVTRRVSTPQPPVVEANGWVMNDKGEVVLIATASTVTSDSLSLTPSQCHVPQTSRKQPPDFRF